MYGSAYQDSQTTFGRVWAWLDWFRYGKLMCSKKKPKTKSKIKITVKWEQFDLKTMFHTAALSLINLKLNPSHHLEKFPLKNRAMRSGMSRSFVLNSLA